MTLRQPSTKIENDLSSQMNFKLSNINDKEDNCPNIELTKFKAKKN